MPDVSRSAYPCNTKSSQTRIYADGCRGKVTVWSKETNTDDVIRSQSVSQGNTDRRAVINAVPVLVGAGWRTEPAKNGIGMSSLPRFSDLCGRKVSTNATTPSCTTPNSDTTYVSKLYWAQVELRTHGIRSVLVRKSGLLVFLAKIPFPTSTPPARWVRFRCSSGISKTRISFPKIRGSNSLVGPNFCLICDVG